MDSEEDELAYQKVANSLHRCYTPIKEQTRQYEDLRGHEKGDKPNLRKKLTRHQLSADVIKDLIEAATVDKRTHAHISMEFNVTKALVSRIIKSHRTNPGYLDGLYAKEKAKKGKLMATLTTAQAFIDRGHHIWRSSQVVEEVRTDHGHVVNQHYVSQVLRHRMGMRYKKV